MLNSGSVILGDWVMKTVVALNQSDCSSTAVQSLLFKNWSEDDHIKLVCVVDPFDEKTNREEAEDNSQVLLEQAMEKLSISHPRVKVSGEVLIGSPHDRLLDVCSNWEADLLVVGAHGSCASSRLMLGSLSSALLNHAPCSVMVIKDNDISSGAQFRNILIPVEQSERSAQAVQYVLDTHWPEDVTFHVVTVIADVNASEVLNEVEQKFVDKQDEEYAQLRQDAETRVAGYAQQMNERFGEDRASYQVLEGNVRDEILKVADNLPAGLIVVGSQGKGFVEKLLLGSVSHTIALQSACSVEVVKPAEVSKEAA